jgi:predicted methyltransferase
MSSIWSGLRLLVLALVLVLVWGLLHTAAFAANDAITAAVANPARSAEDRARDAVEKPAEVMEFAGVRPGQVVADVFGGGGYYSELFSYVVGPSGKVLLINNPPYRAFAAENFEKRFGEGRLPDIEQRLVETGYMQLADRSLDLAVIVMSYHDLYYIDEPVGWPAIDVDRFFRQLHRALKRGGHFLIIDHAALANSGSAPAQTLHRIDEQFAIKDITHRGFVLEKTWDGLRNAADSRTTLVLDPAIRGKTDRFVHLYRKR